MSNATAMPDDVEQAGLIWSSPKPFDRDGKRGMLRTASATEAFWSIYRAKKEALNRAGYRVRKDDRTGKWSVSHLAIAEETPEEIAAREAAIEASRATDAAVDLPVPEGLAYLPYQRAGIAFGAGRNAALIGDEMGLGKTIQAIGIANVTGAKSILVICPASLRLNWQRELGKWLTDKALTIGIVEGGHYPGTDIVVVNYDVLDRHHDRLRLQPWDILIADEAHYLKTRDAKRTKQVFGFKPTPKELAKGAEDITPIPAKRKILLTGTPIANRPAELFPLISYLDPTTWNNFFTFGKRYCAARRNSFGWDFSGASNLDELQNRLRATILVRRLKKDVLTDLPAKMRQVITLPANGAAEAIRREQAASDAAERAIENARIAVELAKASPDPADYEAAVRRLRDASSVAFAEISKMRHAVALAKVPHVIEHLENCGDDKLVIFAHHKDVIEKIIAGLDGKCVKVTGDMGMTDRQASVDAFQNDPSTRYIIGTIGAMGVGLTLTAASHVVFAELDWVPGNVSQAEDRCHRIGQRESVLIQHIVLDGSLDARMAHVIVSKQKVIDRALDVQHALRAPQEATPAFDWAAATEEAREAEAERLSAQEEAAPVRQMPATHNAKREQLLAEAATITDELAELVHEGLRMLAGLDTDHAQQQNDMGYNRMDGRIGHSLAEQTRLTKLQAALGKKLLRKYRRQLGGLHTDIFGRMEEGR